MYLMVGLTVEDNRMDEEDAVAPVLTITKRVSKNKRPDSQ